ncbi:oxygen-insensitive NADPH nitroreductase [Arenicella xantha]|uniref:Nitroreductase n=1 Tax=Arenicella xantha TaxID=644221 RepID=A0A395JMQ0_9GAMM|nr:oxygen-insensitive NADPH nitroreductase [Arenicella xantha]RBP50908.1 nitroreductase [Arenicella xantha]
MNDTIATILKHRSIRRFSDQPLADSQLKEYIRAGQMASSSSFIQAVSVIRVSDSANRAKFAKLAGGQPYVESAPEFLVFCADLSRNRDRIRRDVAAEEPDFSWTEQFIAATVDVALFAQNVVVAAESDGLGCCYIGGIRNDPEQVTELLALPDLVYPVFGLCLGYPDQDPAAKPRLPIEAVFHQNAYPERGETDVVLDEYDAEVADYYQRRTNGKLNVTFTQQMAKQSASQTRKFMGEYIKKQGFNQH